MAFADSGGTKIYYERHGSGPAIMLVHGSGGHHAAWWHQVANLSRDFTVVTVDLRGFGNSDSSMPEFDGQDFPGDLIAVLDQEDLTDVMVVGQSIGAVAALRAGLSRPDRIGMAVLAHSLGGLSDPELTPLVDADRAEAVKLPVIDRLLSRKFQQEQPEKTFLFKQMGTFNVATMQDLRNLNTNGPTIAEIEASPLQVAFLAGEKDAVIGVRTVERAHAMVRDSVLKVIPNAPHSMYWETPALFNAALTVLRNELTARKAATA